jgi:predicted permease
VLNHALSEVEGEAEASNPRVAIRRLLRGVYTERSECARNDNQDTMNLTSLTSILINIISPVVLVAAVGFILAQTIHVDARPLSRTMLYFFTPSLIFASAYRTKLTGEYVSIAVFALIITALMGIVTWLFIQVLRYDRLTGSAFALGVLFVNAGNYGLPLVLFAYGQEGLARAAFYFTMSAILAQTLAIFIAARGRASARGTDERIQDAACLCRDARLDFQSDRLRGTGADHESG